MSDLTMKAYNMVKKSRKNEKKTETKEPDKQVIPKKFINHILELGFEAKDAARLYESKDDWIGMSTGGRVNCTVRGCSFSTRLCSDCIFEHSRTVHDRRDYPCTHANCSYVAYSQRSFKSHVSKFHSPYQAHNGNHYSCDRPDCKAAFTSNTDLASHERIHSNNVMRCVFCPYVSVKHFSLIFHQRMHFNTRDYMCDTCEKAYTTTNMLRQHIKLQHSEEGDTQCPLCDRVGIRHRIQLHLRNTHKVTGVKWDAHRKQYIVPKQI